MSEVKNVFVPLLDKTPNSRAEMEQQPANKLPFTIRFQGGDSVTIDGKTYQATDTVHYLNDNVDVDGKRLEKGIVPLYTSEDGRIGYLVEIDGKSKTTEPKFLKVKAGLGSNYKTSEAELRKRGFVRDVKGQDNVTRPSILADGFISASKLQKAGLGVTTPARAYVAHDAQYKPGETKVEILPITDPTYIETNGRFEKVTHYQPDHTRTFLPLSKNLRQTGYGNYPRGIAESRDEGEMKPGAQKKNLESLMNLVGMGRKEGGLNLDNLGYKIGILKDGGVELTFTSTMATDAPHRSYSKITLTGGAGGNTVTITKPAGRTRDGDTVEYRPAKVLKDGQASEFYSALASGLREHPIGLALINQQTSAKPNVLRANPIDPDADLIKTIESIRSQITRDDSVNNIVVLKETKELPESLKPYIDQGLFDESRGNLILIADIPKLDNDDDGNIDSQEIFKLPGDSRIFLINKDTGKAFSLKHTKANDGASELKLELFIPKNKKDSQALETIRAKYGDINSTTNEVRVSDTRSTNWNHQVVIDAAARTINSQQAA